MGGATLEALRARIRAIEGAPRIQRRRVPTGVAVVDTLLHGLPEPGIVEVVGPEGSGRTRLVASLVAAETRRYRPVAWVDPMYRLYPPGLEAHGVALEGVLVVRPPEDGSSPWGWATEQLLRSGCFSRVVVDLPPRQGSRRSISHTWARAAEHGCCTALVIGVRSTRELPAEVRLSVGSGRVFVMRDRGAAGGRSAPLPEAPAAWG